MLWNTCTIFIKKVSFFIFDFSSQIVLLLTCYLLTENSFFVAFGPVVLYKGHSLKGSLLRLFPLSLFPTPPFSLSPIFSFVHSLLFHSLSLSPRFSLVSWYSNHFFNPFSHLFTDSRSLFTHFLFATLSNFLLYVYIFLFPFSLSLSLFLCFSLFPHFFLSFSRSFSPILPLSLSFPVFLSISSFLFLFLFLFSFLSLFLPLSLPFPLFLSISPFLSHRAVKEHPNVHVMTQESST